MPGSQQKPIQNSCIWGLGIYFMSSLCGTLGVDLSANVHIPAVNSSPQPIFFFFLSFLLFSLFPIG